MRKYLVTIICLSLIFSLPLGCKKQKEVPAKEQKKKEKAFTVVELKLETDEHGEQHVTGIIVNNTDKEYKHVQIEIDLYDANGTRVGSTIAEVNYLGPGGNWKFKAPVEEENVAKVKLKEVIGF